MTIQDKNPGLITGIIVTMLLSFSLVGVAYAEPSAFDGTYSENPSKTILTEVTFPDGQEELAREITNLLTYAENNPEVKLMVDNSMEYLTPLMDEYMISLATESNTDIQTDYHISRHYSLYDYQVTAWVEYPCQGQWLICKSSTNNNNIDRGQTFSTTVPIEYNPTGRDLQFHHKIKNTSGYSKSITVVHFGSFMDMDAGRSVGCDPLYQTLNYRNYQSHDVRYCILHGIEQGDRAQLSMIIR